MTNREVSVERLTEYSDLRAPIHSYVVFPNASKIVTDSTCVYNDVYNLMRHIAKHKQPIYNIDACTRILRSLAYASSNTDSLSAQHIEEVRSYLATKVA